MSNREKLQGMIQTMPDDRISDVLAYVESIDAPPIWNELWRSRLDAYEVVTATGTDNFGKA